MAPNKKVPVSPVTGLRATQVSPTSVSLTWNAPSQGTPPLNYSVRYRKKGTITWLEGASTTNRTKATVTPLHPATTYQFEIVCRNQ